MHLSQQLLCHESFLQMTQRGVIYQQKLALGNCVIAIQLVSKNDGSNWKEELETGLQQVKCCPSRSHRCSCEVEPPRSRISIRKKSVAWTEHLTFHCGGANIMQATQSDTQSVSHLIHDTHGSQVGCPSQVRRLYRASLQCCVQVKHKGSILIRVYIKAVGFTQHNMQTAHQTR